MAPYAPLSSMSSFQPPKPFQSFGGQSQSGTPTTPFFPTPTGAQVKAINPADNVKNPSNALPPNMTKTASGGTIRNINGGQVYSNPADNPNFKPPVSAPPISSAQGVTPAYAQPGYKSPGQITDDAQQAKINAPAVPTPTQPNPAQVNAPQDTSRQGLLTGLFNQVQQGKQASDSAIAYQKQLATDVGQKNANIVGSGEDLSFKQGEQGALQSLAAIKNQAAQQAVQQTQTQQGQALGAFNSALGYQQPVSGAAYFGDPNSGKIIGGGAGVGQAGDVQGRLAMSNSLPQQKAALATTSGLKDSIQNLISTTGINPSQFTDINSIYQFLNGRVADPRYQALSNSVSQFVQQIAPVLGMDVNTIAANIKGNGGNLADTLNNLYQQAQYKVAVNEASVNGTPVPPAPATTFSGGSSGGQTGSYTAPSGKTFANVPTN